MHTERSRAVKTQLGQNNSVPQRNDLLTPVRKLNSLNSDHNWGAVVVESGEVEVDLDSKDYKDVDNNFKLEVQIREA